MRNIPTAAIIIIGNEILSGRTIDKNIPYLAMRLNELGIKLQHIHVIADVAESIIEITRQCHQKYTYVFTTGGIGPTHDDITAEAIAASFNCPLELDPTAVEILRNHYGDENLNQSRLKMALMPKGSTLIPNPVSAAPGFHIQNVYVMAGVPEIMRAMFDVISARLTPGPKIFSKTVKCLLGESILAEELAEIQSHYLQVDIGSYPYFKNRTFGLCLVLRGIHEEKVLEATKAVADLIKMKGGVPELDIIV